LHKLKRIIQEIAYFVISFLSVSLKVPSPKTLLLIRVDAIGDYFLFRNFIQALRFSDKYRDYKITLVGNALWKDLAVELDSNFVHDFIWINRQKFALNISYRMEKIKEITARGYEVVINSAYSREFGYGDYIANFVSAKCKIAGTGDLCNINQWKKMLSNRFYTFVIPQKEQIMFEFFRNKEFFESVIGEQCRIQKPSVQVSKNNSTSRVLPEKFAVLFMGAGVEFRQWSPHKFAKVGLWLKSHYGFEIVLCGSSADRVSVSEFCKYFTEQFTDLVGKTSLVELLYVINGASLLLSNETSAPHMSVALGKNNIFVVSNGNHFGRFTPYPREITEEYHVVYPPAIENFTGLKEELIEQYGRRGSLLDINDITLESVKRKIREEIT
jgi:ADP-heptose:LPS heptosyltransferase